uniref:beta-glucosidase n=1 Tax=Odontella aurita TaxID=265563 RepID=A0A7S4I986_9STRA|mmetsp:Transcript_21698/g.63809  ORF Transcript_21698/g.63809 Transcript_21698/m.63809 type:complete len:1068 (+) Transcript_21698:71-3274(+)
MTTQEPLHEGAPASKAGAPDQNDSGGGDDGGDVDGAGSPPSASPAPTEVEAEAEVETSTPPTPTPATPPRSPKSSSASAILTATASSSPVPFPFTIQIPHRSSSAAAAAASRPPPPSTIQNRISESQRLRNETSRAIVGQLALDEKLSLVSGNDLWTFGGIERFGVPSITLADGPHGVRKPVHGDTQKGHPATCFPASCALACSWDRTLAFDVGRALSVECEELGVSLLLGPGMNLKRHPCGGRNFEYLSEDPHLSGHMGCHLVRGVQHTGRIGACAKHVAANNQESFRFVVNALIDARTLRELYGAGFEYCARVGRPWALMCAYNGLNGSFCSENVDLFRDWMRREIGFGSSRDGGGGGGGEGIVSDLEGAGASGGEGGAADGTDGDGTNGGEEEYDDTMMNPHIVMSDWGAVNDRVEGIKAGLDLEMPGSFGAHDRAIKSALKDGTLMESQLDECCVRIVQFIQRAMKATAVEGEGKGEGEEETEGKGEDKAQADKQDKDEESQIPEQSKEGGDDDSDEDCWEKHHRLALRAARESIVLLKNENKTLPLREKTGEKVAVIGHFAKAPRYQGSGSSQVIPTRLDSVRDLIQEYAGGGGDDDADNITFAEGYHPDQEGIDESKDIDQTLLNEAVSIAERADVCLLFVGLPEIAESEGFDRLHLRLPSQHDALVRSITKINPRTVIVLSNGGPVELPWIDAVPAAVETYLSGQAGARATLDVLYGRINPSGRLAETFPIRLKDVLADDFFPGNRHKVEYREGLAVGYRYFDTAKKDVLFPFGHGLSYTNFEFTDMGVKEATAAHTFEVSLTVTNTGDAAGATVVQCYVSCLKSEVFRPEQELRAFEKVQTLQPDESAKVTLTLSSRAFSYYDVGMNRWIVEDGEYEIRLCSSSRDVRLRRTVTFDAGGEGPSEEAVAAYPPASDPRDTVSEEAFANRMEMSFPEGERKEKMMALLSHDSDDSSSSNRRVEIHRNSILSECQGSFLGRMLRTILIKSMEGHIESEAGKEKANKVRAAFADNFPLRGFVLFSSGGMTFPVLDWMIDVMNGRYCKAFKGVFPVVCGGRFRN